MKVFSTLVIAMLRIIQNLVNSTTGSTAGKKCIPVFVDNSNFTIIVPHASLNVNNPEKKSAGFTGMSKLKGFAFVFVMLMANLFFVGSVIGQTTNDYRSRKIGNWNDPATWERFDGTNWVAGVPTIAGSVTSIKTIAGTTHAVSLPSGIVSGDLLFQDWSKYRVFGQSNPDFQQSIRTGLGFEIIPTPNAPGFWQMVTYRFGGFYEIGNFQIAGQSINSYGIRAGLNIPISNYNSIDFGMGYSIRGKSSNQLIKEEYFNLTAGVNFGELWFLRPREEDQ